MKCVFHSEKNLRATTKGQNRFIIFHTFSEFFTLFHNFSSGTFPFKTKGLAQGEQKRRKDNKRNGTNRFCTFVVARLSSSYSLCDTFQRKTKGQQLKGKIVSALFHTFWHFSTLFHTSSEFFRIYPPGLSLRIKGFYCCFSSKIVKENKKKKTKPFCTLVVARLSSSELYGTLRHFATLHDTLRHFLACVLSVIVSS